MKFTPIFALLALNAPVVAHAQTAATPAVAAVAALPLAPKSAETSDAFVWRFAPPVGSRWTMRSFTRTTSTSQMFMTQENKPTKALLTTYTNKFTADYDVLSRDALGATTIRMTLREATQDATFTNQGKTTPMRAPKPANPLSLNGATLTIKQAPNGKIWNVVGMRAFLRRVLQAEIGANSESVDNFLNTIPAATVSDIVQSLSARTGTLPLSPVRVGESWNYTASLPVPSPYTPEIAGTRTLKKLDSELAVIVDNAHLNSGKSLQKLPDTLRRRNVTVNYSQLTAIVNGTTRVQRSSGLPLETTLMQSIKGRYLLQSPFYTHAQILPVDNTTSMRIVLEPRS